MLCLGLLAGCTQDQAPVQDKGKVFYKYGGQEADNDDVAPVSHNSVSRNSADAEDPQPVFKSGYTRKAKSAEVGQVGVSDLSSPAQHGTRSVLADGGGITVSDDTVPFAPPSRPLDKPAEAVDLTQPEADKAIIKAKADSKTSAGKGISLILPVNGGKITSRFRPGTNDGINIAANEGEPVMASASGMVVYIGNNIKNYGNMVVLKHDNAWMTVYANASSIAVKKNDYVRQGDLIAYVGSTGGVKTPQLHFSLRSGENAVDPEKYLPAASQL